MRPDDEQRTARILALDSSWRLARKDGELVLYGNGPPAAWTRDDSCDAWIRAMEREAARRAKARERARLAREKKKKSERKKADNGVL